MLTWILSRQLAAREPHLGLQAVGDDGRALGLEVDVVSAGAAVDGHEVGRTVRTTGRALQVDLRDAEVGAGHVVDGDRVDAAERRQVELLDAVHVHADVGDVTEEQRALPVRGQAHLLVGARAVEVERVAAGLALDDVAAVTRVPAEAVRTRTRVMPVSLPRLPSTASRPRPPKNSSAPSPPSKRVVAAARRTTVTASSAKAPLTWSMRTWSSPPRAKTLIWLNVARSKLRSARAVVAEVDLQDAGAARPRAAGRSGRCCCCR